MSLALGADLDTSQDATDTYAMTPGANHKGSVRPSMVARKLGCRFGSDLAMRAIERSDSKRERVMREKVSAFEHPFVGRYAASHAEAREG